MRKVVEDCESVENAKRDAILAGLEEDDIDYGRRGPPPPPLSETIYGSVRNAISVLLKSPHTLVISYDPTFVHTVKGALLLLVPEITCVEEENKTTFSLCDGTDFPLWAYTLFSHNLGVHIHHKTFEAYYCNHIFLTMPQYK
jgi:hypothetical protein